MITHLEPHILECKVKWGLGSITTNKASGGDGIQGELFQILKDNKFRQRFKNQRRHFANKVCLVKAMVFPVVKYGYESRALLNCGAGEDS